MRDLLGRQYLMIVSHINTQRKFKSTTTGLHSAVCVCVCAHMRSCACVDDAELMINLQHNPNKMDINDQDTNKLHHWAETIYAMPSYNDRWQESVLPWSQLGITFDETLSWKREPDPIMSLLPKQHEKGASMKEK